MVSLVYVIFLFLVTFMILLCLLFGDYIIGLYFLGFFILFVLFLILKVFKDGGFYK